MKYKRIVPSKSPVTSIVVEGKPHHFFHSKVLGRVRAVMIEDSENLPVPFTITEKGLSELIFDEIEAMKHKSAKNPEIAALYEELDGLMAYLRFVPINDDSDYAETLAEIHLLRTRIIELEQSGYDRSQSQD